MSWRLVSSSAPQSTTTLVVPSPASMSCDLESSTSILAVGWKTCMWLMMVAPSFVMMTSPSLDWIILSMPFGPSEDRTASATPLAAMMFALRTSCSLARSWKRPPPPAAPAPTEESIPPWGRVGVERRRWWATAGARAPASSGSAKRLRHAE